VEDKTYGYGPCTMDETYAFAVRLMMRLAQQLGAHDARSGATADSASFSQYPI